jgi:hypothetical protein
MDVAELINKYGFPIVAAGGMGYLIYYVWEWATRNRYLRDVVDGALTGRRILFDEMPVSGDVCL